MKRIIDFGVIIGITLSTFYLRGGYDSFVYYLNGYNNHYPIPVWGYFLRSEERRVGKECRL